MQRTAIIDLGTNTFHLMVADINAVDVKIVHKEKQSVKIGEGGISHGEIVAPAMHRALRTLKEFKETMESLGVQNSYTSATSAFRNASNGKFLAEEIQKQLGLKVDIIDGKQEANLIYQGVRQAMDLGSADSLIMDIGGGSVEFVIGNRDKINWMHSFEIGAQRLMDKFHDHDPISSQEIQNLEQFLDSKLESLASAIEQHRPITLVGSAGTFDTLSNIYRMMQGLEKPHNSEQPLSLEGFHEIHNELVVKNRADRLKIPGMIEMRVDMIVVASSLVKYVLTRFNLPSIRISSYALKEGALFEICKTVRNQGI